MTQSQPDCRKIGPHWEKYLENPELNCFDVLKALYADIAVLETIHEIEFGNPLVQASLDACVELIEALEEAWHKDSALEAMLLMMQCVLYAHKTLAAHHIIALRNQIESGQCENEEFQVEQHIKARHFYGNARELIDTEVSFEVKDFLPGLIQTVDEAIDYLCNAVQEALKADCEQG